MPISDTHCEVGRGATRAAALMWPADAGRTCTAACRCPAWAGPAVPRLPALRAVAPTASSARARTVAERRVPAVAGEMPMGLLGTEGPAC